MVLPRRTTQEPRRPLPSLRGWTRKFSSFLRFQQYRSDHVSVSSVIVALDGTGDFDDIQAAIDSLPDTGGEVVIKAGIYTINSAINISKSDVHLIGSGHSTKIQTTSAIKMINVGVDAKSDRVIIENLFLSGSNTAGQYGIFWTKGTDGKIFSCWIDNMGFYGILINFVGSSNNIIYKNTITNSGMHGIQLSEADDCIIRDNIIDGGNATAIQIQQFLGTSDRNLITGNLCKNNERGVRITGNNNFNIIVYNMFRNNTIADITDLGNNTQIGHNITDRPIA